MLKTSIIFTPCSVLQLMCCIRIQDHEEISAQDIADAVAEMHARRRYRRLFVILETCQASTMFARVRSPNVFMLAASLKGMQSMAFCHKSAAKNNSLS